MYLPRSLILLGATLWLSAAAVARAEPIATTAVAAKDLPSGVTARGDKVLRAVRFADKNGANYVVFSTKTTTKPGYDGMQSRSVSLFVEDWAVPAKGAPRNLLPVRDFVDDCQMGEADAAFHDDAFTVTDLDGDGFAEITIGYELACRSDVSPAVYKLLLLENGAKYALRGKTRVRDGDGSMGGEFAADPADAKWPKGCLAHAKDVWAKTSGDLQIPPPK